MRIRVAGLRRLPQRFRHRQGLIPGIAYPRIPGHEVIGVIDALGPEVDGWAVGARVGVGWFSGSCGYCGHCRRGDGLRLREHAWRDRRHPRRRLRHPHARRSPPPSRTCRTIWTPSQSAPLLCAGITTFNAIRHCGAGPGDLVAVHGVGGLGHLGIQFAARQGFRTVAVNRGRDKEELAR